MTIGDVLEGGLFIFLASAIVIIVLAVLKIVPRGKKGAYRTTRYDKRQAEK